MKVLHMTLKKKWFDMIQSGVKKEEYREMKKYWHTRLLNREYDVIRFKNGYNPDSPEFDIEFNGLESGLGIAEWGAPDYPVYIIKLGKVLSSNNKTI
jgi:hypothetical protein